MISLLQLLPPADFLIHCLNAAVASLVACGIAVALSRRAAWSLPMRHALLATALAASLTAPLIAPWFTCRHTPNFETFDELDLGIATCQEKSWNERALPFTTALDRPVIDEKYSGQISNVTASPSGPPSSSWTSRATSSGRSRRKS